MTRWIRLEETSPSGNLLFKCSLCGRITKAPTKTCPAGCGEDGVSPEYLEAVRLEREKFMEGRKNNGLV